MSDKVRHMIGKGEMQLGTDGQTDVNIATCIFFLHCAKNTQ
jgi:hypothetical protein